MKSSRGERGDGGGASSGKGKGSQSPFPPPSVLSLSPLRCIPRLTPEQCGVFCALYEWRDRVCREEDESTGYVLPKAQLAMLAQEQPGVCGGGEEGGG